MGRDGRTEIVLIAAVKGIDELSDATLPAAEQTRADAIARSLRRRQFVAGRMLLRTMLAQVLGGRPEDWAVDAEAGAPPRLPSHPHLHLSVSHSGEWVAAAIADRPVGIDLEGLGARRDPERFARWVCSPDELAAWRGLAGTDADDALIAHWTRKEAWLKREGGEVLLTRMHRLHAESREAPAADVATWRVGEVAMLSLCATDVAESVVTTASAADLRALGTFRMTDLGEAAPSRRRSA